MATHPLRIANYRAYLLSRLIGTVALAAQGFSTGHRERVEADG